MAASSSSSKPHFFKIILPQTLTQLKLEIPKNFVRKYGEALKAEEIWVKVMNGAEWKIGLKKSNEKIWFEKGWDEFVKFYSIKNGHFLTFRYEGNFCFHVIIFDKTATEIEYPNSFRKFEEGKRKLVHEIPIKREREEVDKNNELCVQITLDKKMKKSDQIFANKFTWRSNEFQEVEMKNKQDLKNSELNKDLKLQKGINKGKIWSKKSSTIEKASKFKSISTNPSFVVTMGPSYLHTGKSNLNIPIGFANTYLKKTKDLILCVSDEKMWKICCVERWSLGSHKFEMANGWKEFARDNSLKEGDICVFELMKNIQISLFKATIFRFGS